MIATLVVVSASAGWAIAELVDALWGRTVPVPWTAPATLFVLALALFFWAIGWRRKLRDQRVDPFVAARTAALAMAASRTGAIATGVYAGFLIWLTGQWAVPIARERAVSAAAAVLCGILVTAAALWLEKICRIKAGDGDDDDDENEADPSPDWVHPRVG